MSASRIAALIGVFVLCSVLSNTQQTPTAPTGTFQIVPADYTVSSSGAGTWEQHTVFLLNSKDGEVWEYIAAHKSDDGKFHDAVLLPIHRMP